MLEGIPPVPGRPGAPAPQPDPLHVREGLLARNAGDVTQTFVELKTYVNTLKVFLSGLTTITLRRSFQTYTDAERHAAIRAIATNTTLTSVNLSHNPGIDAVDAAELARNNTIINLSIDGASVGDVGAAALAQNTCIVDLNLNSNNISHVGAAALATNRTISFLHLDHNRIGDAGATALTTSVTNYLYLCENGITHVGVAQLATNKKVQALILDGNAVGPEGITALAANTTIIRLSLKRNGIGNAAPAIDALKAFARNTTCFFLNMDNNDIGDAGCAALSNSLGVAYLILSVNNITDAGAAALAKLKQLISLDLDGNNIGDQGILRVCSIPRLDVLSLAAQQHMVTTDVGVAAIMNRRPRFRYLKLSSTTVISNAALRDALHNQYGAHVVD